MTVTITELTKPKGNEVTCTVGQVESGVGINYIGTDVGDVLKYNESTKAITTLVNVGGYITSMMLYSGILWVGVKGGRYVAVTTY
jgi:hypothetical protein